MSAIELRHYYCYGECIGEMPRMLVYGYAITPADAGVDGIRYAVEEDEDEMAL